MTKKLVIMIAVVIAAVIAIYFVVRSAYPPRMTAKVASPGVVRIVAAENFYGDIAGQLGGSHASVISILSDPNVDPHEYESGVRDGIAIANADIVIENGLQYDTWMDKLLSASTNPSRIVIVAGNVAPHRLPNNPHVWYGIDNISAIAGAITDALGKIDPGDASFFKNKLAAFDDSLAPLRRKMSEIRSRYAGTPVALTETICRYQTGPMGLNVLTPFDFEKAIAEGNEPPARTISVTNRQVTDRQVKILIYNRQTVTPITTDLQNEARQNNIPVVPVSETMPGGSSYQTWMLNQLGVLQQALGRATGR